MKNPTSIIYFQGIDLICEYDRDDGELLGAEIITGLSKTDWFFDALNEHKRLELEKEFYKQMKLIRDDHELEQKISNREAVA